MVDCGCGLAESPYKIFLKKANFFDRKFGYVEKMYYLCSRKRDKGKKKFLNIKYYEDKKFKKNE